MDKPKTNVAIRDWPGLVTSADRADVPPGCGTIQVNMLSERQGEMRVRRGLSRVYFDLSGFLVLADSILVSESVSVTKVFPTLTPSESVAISESVVIVVVHLANLIDGVTLSEQVSAIRYLTANKSDSVSITESVAVLLTLFVRVSDTATASEAVSALWSSQFDTFAATYNSKLFVLAGEFTSTVLSSSPDARWNISPLGLSWDGTNTPWMGTTAFNAHMGLQSGRFSSTVKTSLTVNTGSTYVYSYGISWDGTNTPRCATDGVTASKLYVQAGQFTSTITTSRIVTATEGGARGISWDGVNTPWSGIQGKKLYLQSGHFASTLKTSVSVGSVDTPTGISWNNTNTLWSGVNDQKLYLQSGQFSSTLKTSIGTPEAGVSPYGIETAAVSLRLL